MVSRGEKGYEAKAFRWGLVRSWAKDPKIGAKMINARSDSFVPKPKPSFRSAFAKRRCLVPASGYFEWKGESPNKQPYFIHDPAGHLLMFAGLWGGWRASQDEEWTQTFTIITGEPGKVSGDIHDWQPVILPPDLWQVWIEGSPDGASATLVAAREAELVYHPVTKAVGKPTNKGRELVQPI